jgi:hypothetical protein
MSSQFLLLAQDIMYAEIACRISNRNISYMKEYHDNTVCRVSSKSENWMEAAFLQSRRTPSKQKAQTSWLQSSTLIIISAKRVRFANKK